MIRKALEYIVGLGEANVKEYVLPDGEKGLYSDKPLQRLETPVPVAEKLYLHTLTGLVDYIKSGADKFADKMIVEVQSPTNVHLYSKLNEKRCREYLIEVDAMVPEFGFDRFYEQENFCIALQSKFVPNEDRELLLKFRGRRWHMADRSDAKRKIISGKRIGRNGRVYSNRIGGKHEDTTG